MGIKLEVGQCNPTRSCLGLNNETLTASSASRSAVSASSMQPECASASTRRKDVAEFNLKFVVTIWCTLWAMSGSGLLWVKAFRAMMTTAGLTVSDGSDTMRSSIIKVLGASPAVRHALIAAVA